VRKTEEGEGREWWRVERWCEKTADMHGHRGRSRGLGLTGGRKIYHLLKIHNTDYFINPYMVLHGCLIYLQNIFVCCIE
jgi:hypothetical protein